MIETGLLAIIETAIEVMKEGTTDTETTVVRTVTIVTIEKEIEDLKRKIRMSLRHIRELICTYISTPIDFSTSNVSFRFAIADAFESEPRLCAALMNAVTSCSCSNDIVLISESKRNQG